MLKQVPSKKTAVLVSTGAHNPPHLGHLRMLSLAKQQLEAQGYEVVQTFTSPSHAKYVESKGGKVNIDGVEYKRPVFTGHERRRLWRRLIRDYDPENIDIHKFESKVAKGFIDYPDIFKHIIDAHSKDFPGATFFYVAGEDLVSKGLSGWFPPFSPVNPFNFVCVGRDNEISPALQSQVAHHAKSTGAQSAIVSSQSNPVMDMSSTRIMQGNVDQIKLLPYPYILELVNIINHKEHVDPNYKKAFFGKISQALEQMIPSHPILTDELKQLKQDIDKLMHGCDATIHIEKMISEKAKHVGKMQKRAYEEKKTSKPDQLASVSSLKSQSKNKGM